ncbi:hypothetical protein ACHWQZ_G013688 [Mnemiopsis leidyi]
MFCVLIPLLLVLGNARFPDFCFQPSSVTEGDVQLDQNNKKGAITTTAALIGLGETLCYKVKLQSSKASGNRMSVTERLFAVKFVGAQQQFDYKIGYNFSVPILETKCVCSCPNSKSDSCSQAQKGCNKKTDSNSTESSDSQCFVVSATGQTPEGCVWIGGESTTCCQVRVSPDRDQRAAVVELSTMKPRLLFNVTVLDLSGRTVIKEEQTLPLVDSAIGVYNDLDELYRVKMTMDGRPKSIISPGKYILYNDKVYHFLGNSPNELNDHDLNKIGWYKEDGAGVFDVESIVDRAMKIRTSHCGRSTAKIEFNGRYFSTEDKKYRLTENLVPLEDYYAPEIRNLEVNSEFHSRYVSLTQESSPRVSVDFKIRRMNKQMVVEVLDAAWLHDSSLLGDFRAFITIDRFGNNILAIELDEVVGEIIGEIEDEVPEDLTITISKLEETISVRQKVVTTCRPGLVISLKTSSTQPIRRNVSCTGSTVTVGTFLAPPPHLYHTEIEDMSYHKLWVWEKSANPRSWGDGKYEHGELIVALLYLVAIVVFTGLVFRIYKVIKRRGETDQSDGHSEDGKHWPNFGNQMNMRVNRLSRLESEGLEEFSGMNDVGIYSKSLEDMLNDGSRSEDWHRPRMHRRGSSF